MTPPVGHGQVWWADIPGDKVRPVVVLTRATIAPLLSRVLVAPVTTAARGLRTEVGLGSGEGVRAGSVANLDNAQLLELADLLQRIGEIPPWRWVEFCRAMARVMACPA